MVQCGDKIVKRHIDQLRIRHDNGKSSPEFHLAPPIFTHVGEIAEQESILQGGGQSYRKNITKTNVTYYKCSNCDSGCPLRLIVRNNEISEKCDHNCKTNSLVIRFQPQIVRDLLLTMRDQFHLIEKYGVFSYQKTAGLNRNEFDRGSMSPPLSLLPNNQPFFRCYWVVEIFIKFNIK
ncbi:hypothetical protein HZS_910 [Henneguya salminicola]|nr:hypothetical protein HZS_910 [Henneguya salminicola]